MARFEKVSKYKSADLAMPVRKTSYSAGYDMAAAEDYIIPSVWTQMEKLSKNYPNTEMISLDTLSQITKAMGTKPTLVSTGMKCKLESDKWLQLSVRSSSPLKYWLMLANGIGVIDADYYNNPDNEGEIFFQIYNLSPFDIIIKKGDIIGQGVILPYLTTEDDSPEGERTGGFGSTTK